MTKIKPVKISVGIVKSEQINFILHNDFILKNENIKVQNKAKAFVENNILYLEINNKKTEIQSNKITFEPSDKESCCFEIEQVTIGVDFHWQQKENQKFKGILILLKIDNKVQVINKIDIEDYLLSVISSEMSGNCSLEFLKAHSIISRSWLLAQIQKQKELTLQTTNYKSEIKTDNEYLCWYDRENHTLFDVCADDHCQRYQGITRIQNKNVEKAVNETAGIVLMYNGKICDARFSKCCGGVSEIFENCWENTPHDYLPSIYDNKENKLAKQELQNEENATEFIESSPKAFCNTADKKILNQVLNNYDAETQNFFRWQVSYSQKEISNLINSKSGIDFGDILDFVPVERGKSGRLIKLKIIGSKKTLTIGKELEIRRWLSKSHLYSSAFTVTKNDIVNNVPQQFTLNGAGWGHGVGLCQIGAAAMGEKGYSYKEILEHYFNNFTLEVFRN